MDEEYKSSSSSKKSKKEDNNENDLMNEIVLLKEQNKKNVIEMKANDKQLKDREKTIAILRQKDESTEAERKEMMNMNISGSSQIDMSANHLNGYSNGTNKHKIVDGTNQFPKKKKLSNEMI
jgi:DNA-directed RNA polymerase specialized sigma subunit